MSEIQLSIWFLDTLLKLNEIWFNKIGLLGVLTLKLIFQPFNFKVVKSNWISLKVKLFSTNHGSKKLFNLFLNNVKRYESTTCICGLLIELLLFCSLIISFWFIISCFKIFKSLNAWKMLLDLPKKLLPLIVISLFTSSYNNWFLFVVVHDEMIGAIPPINVADEMGKN